METYGRFAEYTWSTAGNRNCLAGAHFFVGIVRTCSTVAELKKPEHAVKLFIRFAIDKGVVTYGLELMLAIFNIVQGVIETIMKSAGVFSSNRVPCTDNISLRYEELYK